MRAFNLINELKTYKNTPYGKALRVVYASPDEAKLSPPMKNMDTLKRVDNKVHDFVVAINGIKPEPVRDNEGYLTTPPPKGGLAELDAISSKFFLVSEDPTPEAQQQAKKYLERMAVLLKQLEKDLDALNNMLLEYRKNNLDYLLNRDEIQLQQFLTDLRNLRSAIKGRDRGNVGYKDFGILRKPASLKPFHLERPLNPEEIKEHLQDTCSIYVYSQTGSRKLELYSDQETGLSLGEITNEEFDLALQDYMSKGNKVEIKSNTAKGTVYRFASPMAKQLFLRSLATKVMPEKQRQNAQQAQQLAEQLGGNLPGAMGQGPRILPPGFDPDNLPGAVRPGRGP